MYKDNKKGFQNSPVELCKKIKKSVKKGKNILYFNIK